MGWFLLALLGPFLYAITNYLDKLVLERYVRGGSVATVLIFSGVFSGLSLPLLWLADPTVLRVSETHLAALAGVGVLNFLVLLFYLKAIQGDEVSTAIIFYQLVPVLAYGLGYAFLGETLTARQLVAMALIVLGTSVVSFSIDDGGFTFRGRTVLYMLAASFCWALGAVLFKAVALEEQVVRSLFWENLTLAMIGAGIVTASGRLRDQFLGVLRSNAGAVLSLNAVNESAYIAANVAMAFAYLLAPVSLVLLANSYQAVFVMVIGACISHFRPALLAATMRRGHLLQKVLAIAITALGTYELLSSGR